MRQLTLLSGLILALASSAAGETYVVNPDGTGDFPTIQAAIDSVLDGDVIELADGVFTGEGNRDIDYLGKAITVRSQSGDPDSCTIHCSYLGRGFIFQSGEDSTSVLDGVAITGGYLIVDGYGGGIYCDSSSPTIINCAIRGNVAGITGGGIYFHSSSPNLHNCTISDNTCFGDAGGIYFESSTAEVTACSLFANSAGDDGGAIQGVLSALSFVGCMFQHNSSPNGDGGAIEIGAAGSSLNLVSCTFSGNSAGGTGGAVYATGGVGMVTAEDCTFSDNIAGENVGGLFSYSCSSLINCTFRGNRAQSGPGGGLYLNDCSPTMANCTFLENVAREGGGIYLLDSSPSFNECLFSGNSAILGPYEKRGGAVYCHSGSPVFANCTFSCNSSLDNGGGIYSSNESSSLEFDNCTFFDNSARQGGGAYFTGGDLTFRNSIIAFGSQGEAVYCWAPCTPTLTCCDIYGNAGGDWVGGIANQYGLGGNICEDPWFCDPETGDFTLHEDSPCAPYSPPNPECDLIGAWPVGCAPMAVPNQARVPMGLRLGANIPNPFTLSSRIDYSVPGQGSVRVLLSVYDGAGRLVRALANGSLPAGGHSVSWDGTDQVGRPAQGGVYFYRLSAGGETATRRMLLLR